MARSAIATPTTKTRKAAPSGQKSIRTYKSALNWLDSLTNYERMSPVEYNRTNFSLSRMSRLLASMGNPHRQIKTVHIAGTKGKGSTATMLAHMLLASGYNVGMYTSPHLITVRERIWVSGKMIGETQFSRMTRRLVESLNNGMEPKYFEALTAIAFAFFLDRKVDIAVIETGLGGRLDSTNVIKPEVCGITSISRDHVHQLGSTLSAIAEEKAGIFKPGIQVISVPQVPEVKKTLEEVAARTKSPLAITGQDIEFSVRFESSRTFGPHTRLSLTTSKSRFEHLHVPLLGAHQAINCTLALGILDALKDRGFEIDDQKAISGLSDVRLAGRMEMISEEPRILVDAAHNAASIEALMRAIGQNVPYDSMVVIFGCNKDKDAKGMLRLIQLGADKAIFTPTGSARSMDPDDLAAIYSETTTKMVQVAPTIQEAVRIASSATTKGDLICITGSFYLVGLAKTLFQKTE